MQTETKPTRRIPASALVIFGLMALLGLGTMTVAASGVGDVPGQLGTALGIDSGTAGILLAGATVISISLMMAAARQPMIPTAITLLAAIGMVTALGWVQPWLLILAALAFVTLFTKKVADTFTGGGKGAE